MRMCSGAAGCKFDSDNKLRDTCERAHMLSSNAQHIVEQNACILRCIRNRRFVVALFAAWRHLRVRMRFNRRFPFRDIRIPHSGCLWDAESASCNRICEL